MSSLASSSPDLASAARASLDDALQRGVADGDDPEPELDWSKWRRGMRDAFGLPALMLAAALIGVGGLCRDIGYPMGAGMLSTILIWAGPAQMVMFGSIAAGASLLTVAAAVSFTSIRFLPMCVAILPLLRMRRTPLWLMVVCAHFVAITAWVHSMRVLPEMPREARIPYFLGFAMTVMASATFATGAGYFVIGQLPGPLAASLLMTSPLFFTISMMAAARKIVDWLALALGFLVAPFAVWLVAPGLDLLAGGLIAGTVAYLVDRVLRARREMRHG